MKKILLVVFGFSLINFLLLSLSPTRKELVDFWWGSGELAYYAQLLTRVLLYLVYALFFGYLTDLILQKVQGKEICLSTALMRSKLWFVRSLVVLLVGRGGLECISFFVSQIDAYFLSSFLGVLIGGLWITLTFTLYPTMIASRKPILKSIADGFSINIKSVNQWFYLLLILFFISGGFVYIWIPKEFAQLYVTGSEDLSGWMFHIHWLGGYSFNSNWYTDYARYSGIQPSNIILSILFFTNVIIATAIKIKVTKILFESGYLSENSEKAIDTVNVVSIAETRCLGDKPLENINLNSQNLENEQPEFVY